MLPRATRRLTPRTATKPAKSLARSSVSRTVSLPTTVPHAGHFRRLWPGRKGDKKAGLLRPFGRQAGTKPPLHIQHRRATLSRCERASIAFLKPVENSSAMKSERAKWLVGKSSMWLTAAAVCDTCVTQQHQWGRAAKRLSRKCRACAERSTRTRDPGWGAICCAKPLLLRRRELGPKASCAKILRGLG